MARKPIKQGPTKAATKYQQAMGDVLDPMNVPGPGSPMTRLFANDNEGPSP
jgi:hypothetical protein